VRTCRALTAAVNVWTTKKAFEWTLDGFKSAIVGVLADLCLTGGAATMATMIYDAYEKIRGAIDIHAFVSAPRSKQAAVIKHVIESDDVDVALGLLA